MDMAEAIETRLAELDQEAAALKKQIAVTERALEMIEVRAEGFREVAKMLAEEDEGGPRRRHQVDRRAIPLLRARPYTEAELADELDRQFGVPLDAVQGWLERNRRSGKIIEAGGKLTLSAE